MRKLPVIGVGAVVIHRDRVLLVKRANPPFEGLWTIPGGKVQWGETLQQAAEREILEETGITIKAKKAIFAFDLINKGNGGIQRTKPDSSAVETGYHYVVIDLESEYVSGEASAKSDAADVAWFDKSEIDSNEAIQDTTRQLLKEWWY